MNLRWTKKRIEKLLALRSEGHSGAQIAKLMGDGVTKNSIIGKLNRLKAPTVSYVPLSPMPKPKSKPLPSFVQEPPAKTHTLLENLGPNQCRYPINKDHPFIFCGARKEEASSYCVYHQGIVYKPSERKRNG
jgi:GcrA cell cycle regulator